MRKRHFAWFLVFCVAWLLFGCAPAVDMVTPSSGNFAPTVISHDPGVADLLRNPSAPGATVELDAYYDGATYTPFPDPREPSVCPSRWNAALTDRPLRAQLYVLYSMSGNGPPEDAPWLIAAQMKAQTPEPGLPELPYHARLRGHLGDPAFAQCQDAERIFVVEQVVKTYQQDAPESKFPLPDDFATWQRYHDETLGYGLRYSPAWEIERPNDAALVLRAPQWQNYPIRVRVYAGETHIDPYDLAAILSLAQGGSWGVFQQVDLFDSKLETQHLDGYETQREINRSEREVAALFSGSGRTYELSLRYPIGFDASQPLLTAYTVVVQSFRLDVLPGPSPTPPVRQTLGKGPFISQDEAVARARDHNQRPFTLLDAHLVPEVDIRRPDRACSGTIQGHFDGIWVLTVKYMREGTEFTADWFLNASNGEWLCGEEISTNATPFPVTIPPGAPTPAPTRTPFPTSTRVSNQVQVPSPIAHINQPESVAIYSAVIHHLFGNPQGTPGREKWDAIYLNPILALSSDRRNGMPTPARPVVVPEGLVVALADLAPRVELRPRGDFGVSMPWGTIWVSLGAIEQRDDSATVGIEWFLSGTGGAGYEYRLVRANGVWQVLEAKMLWIARDG